MITGFFCCQNMTKKCVEKEGRRYWPSEVKEMHGFSNSHYGTKHGNTVWHCTMQL